MSKIIDITSRLKGNEKSYVPIHSYNLPNQFLLTTLDHRLEQTGVLASEALAIGNLNGYKVRWLIDIVRNVFNQTYISKGFLSAILVRWVEGSTDDFLVEVVISSMAAHEKVVSNNAAQTALKLQVYFDLYGENEDATYGVQCRGEDLDLIPTEAATPAIGYVRKLIENINGLVESSICGGGSDVSENGEFYAVLPYTENRAIRINLILGEVYKVTKKESTEQ